MGKKYVGQTPSDDKDIVTKKYVDDSAGGGGDVTGPASSVDNSIARLDGVTGKVIQSTPHLTLSDDNKFESSTGTNIELLSVADIEISSGVGAAQSVNITADIDGVVSIKNDNLVTNEISERTASSGVTIEGIRIKPEQIYSASDLSVFAYDKLSLTGDTQVDIYAGIGNINLATATGDIELQAHAEVIVTSDNLKTNIVGERTSSSGVTIDGTLIKDGLVDGRDLSVDGTRLDTITDANYKNSNTTKAQVGLSNVDNTSDTSKPISTLTQTALDGKIGSTTTKKFTLSATAPSSPLDGDLWADKSSTGVSTLVKAVGEMLMPVGTIYSNKTDATNPGTKFGFGTWVPFNTGTVMVSKAPSGTFSAAGTTVGAETHVLTISEMPAHTHSSGRTSGTSGSFGLVDSNSASSSGTWNTLSTGGGLAHNNIQPSTVTYMWERTA